MSSFGSASFRHLRTGAHKSSNASRERCCGPLRNAINARNRCKRRELKARRRRPSKMISTAPRSRTCNRAGRSPPTPLLSLGIWLLWLRSSSESPLSHLACVDNKPISRLMSVDSESPGQMAQNRLKSHRIRVDYAVHERQLFPRLKETNGCCQDVQLEGQLTAFESRFAACRGR
jgi:hypothetical protein